MVSLDWALSVLCSVLLRLINQLVESVWGVMDHVPKVQCEWVELTDVIYIAECPGGKVTQSDSSTRDPFINCTVVTGNLVVGVPPVFGSSESRIHWLLCNVLYCYSETTLNILNTIQEIKGTLSIENWPYTTFPYLSKLRILGSNITNLRPFPSECANGSSVRYALYIDNNNNLTSIDLSSLREINGGGFHQTNNPQLCLIGNLSSLVTSKSAPVCVTSQGRRDPQQCGETNGALIYTNSCCSLQYQLVWYAVMSVMMRLCAGGQELTSVSLAGTFSINPMIPVCPLVMMSALHSEWQNHVAFMYYAFCREYYGDSANMQAVWTLSSALWLWMYWRGVYKPLLLLHFCFVFKFHRVLQTVLHVQTPVCL